MIFVETPFSFLSVVDGVWMGRFFFVKLILYSYMSAAGHHDV